MSQPTSASAAAQLDLPPLPENVVVETRFGCYAFGPEHRVHMPKGLLGFQDAHDFALANLPDPRLADFKLLQSLEKQELSFIVTPLPEACGPIAAADLAEIAETAGIGRERAIFLLIVTIRPDPSGQGIVMTVNLRAPLVFDPASRLARQCITANPAYPVQQPFFGWGPALPAND